MALNLSEITAALKQQIESFEAPVETVETGTIIEIFGLLSIIIL